ncbi:transmembrane protein 25 [Columba livia]|uniref:Transmembrane protein 25 n=1 Tax=Columba livia TaxID=8932 RepID=A0A2I0LQE4_COLLI|nr:transmembrane protein 25 [Columba livia]
MVFAVLVSPVFVSWRGADEGAGAVSWACGSSGSTITLTARRSDHQLSCSLMDVASGEKRDASVLLDVQYKPEILQANARYQEAEGTGLLLLLFVLVQANPPASITWVAPDGQVMANTSEFLLLGTTHHPGLANHSLRVHLSSVAANFSVSAANSMGVTTTSVTTTGVTTASLLPTASPGDAGAGAGEERSARLGLQDSLVLGFVQLPTSGRIYKVPSVSSDEIWL